MIEIIVTLGIVGIVGVFLAGFLGAQVNTYNAVIDRNSAKTVCTGTIDKIQKDIQYGTDFTLGSDGLSFKVLKRVDAETPVKEQTITIPTVSVSIDGNEIPEYLKYVVPPKRGYKVNLEFIEVDADRAVITPSVKVTNQKGEELYTMSQQIYCPNWGLQP